MERKKIEAVVNAITMAKPDDREFRQRIFMWNSRRSRRQA
jgi:hypothetical protein